jgi:hypothetical protein
LNVGSNFELPLRLVGLAGAVGGPGSTSPVCRFEFERVRISIYPVESRHNISRQSNYTTCIGKSTRKSFEISDRRTEILRALYAKQRDIG